MHAAARWGALLLAGCTGANPGYVPDGGDCQPGERLCVDNRGVLLPVVCGLSQDGQLRRLVELCPSSAGCAEGLCVAPAGARTCARQEDCAAAEVCTPLVVSAGERRLVGTCQPRGAGAAPEAACQRDEDCQSYLCLQHSRGRYCLRACAQAADCKIPATCRTFDVTVTGVQGKIQSCSQG